MASDQRGGASPPGRQCGRCGAPLPDRRTWTCMLNEGCCPACFARCEAAGHCAEIGDEAFWEDVKHVQRVATDRSYPGGRRDPRPRDAR